jgi:hypothetical protein
LELKSKLSVLSFLFPTSLLSVRSDFCRCKRGILMSPEGPWHQFPHILDYLLIVGDCQPRGQRQTNDSGCSARKTCRHWSVTRFTAVSGRVPSVYRACDIISYTDSTVMVLASIIFLLCHRWNSNLDLGCDNVLPGQGCRTRRGTVTDEYGEMVECWLAGEKPEEALGNTVRVPVVSPRISHEVIRDWNRVYAVRSQQIPAWTTAWNRLSTSVHIRNN